MYSKKNKIAVCTWYDDNIKEYADITSEINQKYCDKNNYDYIVNHTRRLKDRHPAWERFALFTKLFKNYDYVVWIDADACFRYDHPNQSLLRDIIHKNKDKDIIFSYDHPRDPSLEQPLIKNQVFVIAVRVNYEWLPLWVGCPTAAPCEGGSGLFQDPSGNVITGRVPMNSGEVGPNPADCFCFLSSDEEAILFSKSSSGEDCFPDDDNTDDNEDNDGGWPN